MAAVGSAIPDSRKLPVSRISTDHPLREDRGSAHWSRGRVACEQRADSPAAPARGASLKVARV
jgi:hypothetical protein